MSKVELNALVMCIYQLSTGVPPYPPVIRSKTYRVYVKPRIMQNAIYNVIFV
jgi:hypothetical protein